MKILISAYACEPGKGSEPEVGWNWALQAARFHEVWVVTRANNRAAIEGELSRHTVPGLHMVYHDLPRWARWWKRGHRGIHLYYLLWQFTALRVARKLHQEVGFDIGHHVTFVSFRYPSFLAWLGVPFVWGPIAGGEQVPRRFYPAFEVRGSVQEALRDLSNFVARYDPLVRFTARNATAVVAATNETACRLPSPAREKAVVMPAIGIDVGVAAVGNTAPSPCNSLRLLFVGRLIHWKGLRFALRALGQAVRSDSDLELTIVGDGPFRTKLEQLTARLGLTDRVQFLGSVPRKRVADLYRDHDALVLPSFRDSGGFVVLEAMAAGLPVVCLRLGGPALTVTDETGIRVAAESPRQVVRDLALAFEWLAKNPGDRQQMGEAGRIRVRELYNWSQLGETLRELYVSVHQDRTER